MKGDSAHLSSGAHLQQGRVQLGEESWLPGLAPHGNNHRLLLTRKWVWQWS